MAGVVIVAVLSYIVSLHDDIYIQQYYEGLWYKDIFNSFKYFLKWVLPYWWFIIFSGGSILGAIIFLLAKFLRFIIHRV